MARPWRAVVVPAGQDPWLAARAARVPVPHAWTSWLGSPALVFTSRDLRPRHVLALCELLADIDGDYLARSPVAPALSSFPVVPRPDLGDPETWLSVPWLLAGWGPADCKGLAAWRVAELRARGEPARFVVETALDRWGHLDYHVRVLRARGRVEDPQREAMRRCRRI